MANPVIPGGIPSDGPFEQWHEGPVLAVGDIVEKNGKTVRENNMAMGHNIPIGTLVEVEYDEGYGKGAYSKSRARLFVVEHNRDCDGTPLYSLGKDPDPELYKNAMMRATYLVGASFMEDGLTPAPPVDEDRGERTLSESINTDDLTKDDWVEIYHALDTKLSGIHDNEFDDAETAVLFRKHLWRIMEKVNPKTETVTQ